MDEIKEAVEICKEKIKDCIDVDADCIECKSIKVLVDLAESYLKIEGFPEHCKCHVDYKDCVRHAERNNTIDKCKLALLKKLEGVEEIMIGHYWDSLEKDRGLIEKHCKFLSNSIKQYLVGGKK